jgi:hypothetical protein
MRISFKEILKITSLPVIAASLCCFSPIIIVLFGLGSVSVASTLANNLYGNYAWVFRLGGLALLTTSVVVYLRRTKGICTLDEAKKQRREIINIVGLVIIAGVIGYVIFLYGVLEIVGIFLKIW